MSLCESVEERTKRACHTQTQTYIIRTIVMSVRMLLFFSSKECACIRVSVYRCIVFSFNVRYPNAFDTIVDICCVSACVLCVVYAGSINIVVFRQSQIIRMQEMMYSNHLEFRVRM